MENCKQEVVEIIQGAFLEHGMDDRQLAEVIASRIAPLIRGEFPSSIVKVALGAFDLGVFSLEECTAEIKRLWEGYTSTLDEIVSKIPPEKRAALDEKVDMAIAKGKKVGDNILEQDKPKGTCQWCKGSGWAKAPHHETCPQCEGTGECQHKGDTIGKNPPKCLDCGEYIDRRSGEKRRLWNLEWTWLMKKHHSWNEGPSSIDKRIYRTLDGDWCTDRRTLKDRRK